MKALFILITITLSVSTFATEMGESQSASCDQSIHLGRFQASKEIVSTQEETQEVEIEAKTISK